MCAKMNNDPKDGNGNQPEYLKYAELLLDEGRANGFIQSESMPFIPELLVCADDVCRKILKTALEIDPNKSPDSLVFAWSAYAGMGAVKLWNDNASKLFSTGVYEALVEPRGFDEMDEYVMDTIGIPFGSSGEKRVTQFLRVLISVLDNQIDFESYLKNDFIAYIYEREYKAQAMFIYGMVFEMNRLGMK